MGANVHALDTQAMGTLSSASVLNGRVAAFHAVTAVAERRRRETALPGAGEENQWESVGLFSRASRLL